MKKQSYRVQNGGWGARSILERGSFLPPLNQDIRSVTSERAGLAQPRTWRLVLFLMLLPSALCLRAWGQSYSLDWSTVDGGGGTSTGGVYTVSGTIGQPDAGVMSGGAYTLNGGFWGVAAAVQTPGAPWLTVSRTTTNSILVSWPLPADGWVLECTNRVSQASALWPQIVPPYQTNSVQAWIVEPAPTGNRFYRLHKP